MSLPTRVRSCLIRVPTNRDLTWEQCGSAEETHFQIWKGRNLRLHAGQPAWLMWHATVDSVTHQIKENSDADVKAEGAMCFLDPYIMVVRAKTEMESS